MKAIKTVLLTIFVLIGIGQIARAEDNAISYAEEGDPQSGGAALVVTTKNCAEATITLTADMTNVDSSTPVPMTTEVTGSARIVLTTFKVHQQGVPWTYNWHVSWKYGKRLSSTGSVQANYPYQLPFKTGEHLVLQAAYGRFTHLRGSELEQAIDIQMPVGTTVTAARGGTVIAVRSDCSAGGLDLQYMADVNYVVIKHSDGTYGEYLHLQKNGALVHVGDTVTTGQAIALSGNTGYTSEPHVHFMVFYNLSGTARRSVPVLFNGANGLMRLQEGYTYRAAQ